MSFHAVEHMQNFSTAEAKKRGSPAVWARFPWGQIKESLIDGVTFFQDFASWEVIATTEAGNGMYLLTVGTTPANAGLVTEQGGVVRITMPAEDNAEHYLAVGDGATNVIGKITAGKKFAAEWRIRPSTVTDDVMHLACILGEEGLAVAGTLVDDTGALTDDDYIGFRTLAADCDGLDIAYNTNGGTEVLQELAGTLVAATWMNIGMYGDGAKVHWFVNNVEVGIPVAYSATGVPDGEELNMYLLVKQSSAVAGTLDVDFMKCGFET